MTLTLEGVPSGQEGDIERALNTFYIQGYVQLLYLTPYLKDIFFRSQVSAKSGRTDRQIEADGVSTLFLLPHLLFPTRPCRPCIRHTAYRPKYEYTYKYRKAQKAETKDESISWVVWLRFYRAGTRGRRDTRSGGGICGIGGAFGAECQRNMSGRRGRPPWEV